MYFLISHTWLEPVHVECVGKHLWQQEIFPRKPVEHNEQVRRARHLRGTRGNKTLRSALLPREAKRRNAVDLRRSLFTTVVGHEFVAGFRTKPSCFAVIWRQERAI